MPLLGAMKIILDQTDYPLAKRVLHLMREDNTIEELIEAPGFNKTEDFIKAHNSAAMATVTPIEIQHKRRDQLHNGDGGGFDWVQQSDGGFRPRQMSSMPPPAQIYQQGGQSFGSTSNPLGSGGGGGGNVSFQSEQPIGQDTYGSLEHGVGGGGSAMRGVAPLPPMRPSPGGAFMGRDTWGPSAGGTETTTAPVDQSHGTYVV